MLEKNNLKHNFKNFLTKKIFSEIYYNKFYIRNSFLDTGSNLYNFKKNVLQGHSVCKNIYIYSHIYNNKFTFNSFLNKKSLHSKFFFKNFYKGLLTFKKKKFFFILLKPTKGGFISYFSGIVGFIPKNNILFLVRKIVFKLKTALFFSLSYNFIKINLLLKSLRFSGEQIKIKLFQYYKKRNFSGAKKFKFRKLFFNSLFLLKKKIKVHHEIKKFKKKYKTTVI
jgi:hypothetical protein